MMKNFFIFIFFMTASLVNAGSASVIKVAASSNLNQVMEEIKVSFISKNKDLIVEISYNSSGKLVSQIILGADFDVFMSADMDYPGKLYKEGHAVNKPAVYAVGRLVLFSAKPFEPAKWKEFISGNGVKAITIVNPDLGPYGNAAVDFLKASGILEKVRDKLVKTESVSAVVNQTIAASDAGITALSLVLSESMKRYPMNENWILLDAGLHAPIRQGIVILRGSCREDIVRAFYEYIFSDNAVKIFRKYGYEQDVKS